MKNFITYPGLMDSHLTIIGGMIGGWELLVILAVLGMMILVVGSVVVFGIMMLRKSKPVPPSTPPPVPTTPASDATLLVCRSCGTRQPPDAPLGLCPQCLMKAGLKSDAGASKTSKTDVPPLAPTEIAGHFPQLEILEILGQGGMGTVYKARQPHLDRLVALKILSAELSRDPAFAERFQREAKALARLNHPNIVSVFDFGQAGPYYFFVMEYVDGVNLAQLEHSRRLLPAEAMALIPKICDALQYAHDEGVVHRDIKPGNILMDRKGRVKIADFGLAKLVGMEARDFTLTATGMVMGTPRYMAPEQMERPAEVDHRADIYSLGVVFYEMLTGELPMGRFAPPSQKVEIDVRVDEVVLRSLERDVHRRYQQAGDVKTDVESITGLSAAARPAMVPKATAPGAIWHWPGALVALFLVWMIPAALWNFGPTASLAAVFLMGTVFTALTYRQVQHVPALAQAWSGFGPARRRTNLLAVAFCGVTGFFFLFGALATRWETSRANWNSAGQSTEEFAGSLKGQEYKLIRQLSSFQNAVPQAELVHNGGSWTGGWNVAGIFTRSGPHNRLYGNLSVLCHLLVAIVCLLGSVTCLSPPGAMRESLGALKTAAVGLAVPLTTAALLGAAGAYLCLCVAQMKARAGAMTWLASRPLRLAAAPDSVMKAFLGWTEREGFLPGDHSKWELDAVPKGEKLALVQLNQAWKPSFFDRWRMTWHGPEQLNPHFVIQTVSSHETLETAVQLSVGWPPTDQKLRYSWLQQLGNLSKAIEKAEANEK